MKSLEEYLTESLAPVFESTNIGNIPEFTDFKSIRDYFTSISGLTQDKMENRARDMFGFYVELYGGEWNGRHIYVTYYLGLDKPISKNDKDGKHSNLGIWYSEKNAKPKFDIFLMKKSSRLSARGVYPGGSGIDGVQFDLIYPSADFYGNKKAVDDLFGKPMPWMRGSEKAVCETINGIIKEFGIESWQMIRKK